MPLYRVTFTGADDGTDVSELVRLFGDFPFVEWGILLGSHEGVERFPSLEWITDLVEARVATGNKMPLALHVCGKFLRDVAAGGRALEDALESKLAAFSRVQLNWHGERQSPAVGENVLSSFCKMDGFGWEPELIFQLDGVNDDLCIPATRRFACCGLFDRSHGAGVAPDDWPAAHDEMACGWAGGLGPDNLAAELPKISDRAFPALNWWVDMETRVRSDEGFDLGKVRACCEIAAKFLGLKQNVKQNGGFA